jgi:N-acyl-D-amino-acid deacylase
MTRIFWRATILVATVLMMASFAQAQTKAEPVDLLIRGGVVIDGTGAPRTRADVAVKDGRVWAVGTDLRIRPKAILDAGGKIVAPGFIDAHNHSPPGLAEPA